MKLRLSYAVLTVCLMFALTCFFERPAYAYIDPGSGILACQALSAFFVGVLYHLRRRISSWFRPIRASEAEGQAGRSGG